ncbi:MULTISPECIES: SRPBCC family protein [Acidithrix]|uniref:Polyketide cyclase / dehydrase and lipid transport n=1 Tax=Acidithrix ferrooxidans TaxID=1280514 RepID=A0A0D8HHA0_9ACTN|nr:MULTISPECIES: SRPBCC family protein [Acidithrix]KJF17234.1 polyketide cyclase / dehydrase and lipid transport [Acidithrix ferrooxidans]CAG4914260.1 unnamed protein product [Acidithrix sp. C25]
MDKTVETAIVAASPGDCYNIAIDFERYSEWAGDIKSVEVLERDELNRGKRVSFRAAAFGRSAAYTLIYSYGDSDLPTITWSQEKADLTSKLDGRYLFTPTKDGMTEVSYSLEVDLLVPIPGFVKRRAEAKIVHSALKDLKTRVEAKTNHDGANRH